MVTSPHLVKLDDTVFPTDTQGFIFYTDTWANKVYQVVATGLLPGTSAFIDVGNEFGSLNNSTGAVTAVFTGTSPHGADFVTFQAASVPEPTSKYVVLGGLLILAGMVRRRRSRQALAVSSGWSSIRKLSQSALWSK